MKDKRYFTISEAAELLNLSPATVRRMFDDGQLQGFRIPGGNHRRISRSSVLNLLLQKYQQEPDETQEAA